MKQKLKVLGSFLKRSDLKILKGARIISTDPTDSYSRCVIAVDGNCGGLMLWTQCWAGCPHSCSSIHDAEVLCSQSCNETPC
ncbi:MAG: hypothetical protein QM528_08925 [Phycisphaerales bacterium]|nr:hypothetical protein [Phycisphaerales bacterium]